VGDVVIVVSEIVEAVGDAAEVVKVAIWSKM
jgi:hypothetical protein